MSTALITGANRGIGLEFARQFEAKGYAVIGTARNPSEATELAALDVRDEALDVTDAASVAALAKRLDSATIDAIAGDEDFFRHGRFAPLSRSRERGRG